MHILKLKPLSFGSHKLSYHQLLRHNLKNYADAFQVSELSHKLLIFKNCHSLECECECKFHFTNLVKYLKAEILVFFFLLQYTLDLVTLLVNAKTVTKPHGTAKKDCIFVGHLFSFSAVRIS